MRIERVVASANDDAVVDEIVALEQASFTNPWSRETLVWELRNSDVTRIFIVRDDIGSMIAFCACWIIFDELHINTLAVAPAHRRRGVATVLLNRVLGEAAAAGARKATLEVRASNQPAIQLYERLGFRVTAVRERYYMQPDEDALILWRDRLFADEFPAAPDEPPSS
jgi:[ribosomal protein S18]-alanine N-acetyltransferase